MIVETTTGAIRGHKRWDVLRFAGVPYAAAPVGERRFLAPIPHPGWSGVLDTRAVGPMSVQPLRGPSRVPTSEDCLHLNIFAPLGEAEPRPVIVWVHGGGFVQGAASDTVCDGTRLARSNDVVVVTLNYRLGALGWLYLGQEDESVAGSANHGFLDVLAALRWVHDNVASFGGDPGNVTLAGQSSGAMTAIALMGHPEANHLVHRVIAQSGGAQHTKTLELAVEVSERFRKIVAADSARALRATPTESIIAAQEQVVRDLTRAWHRHPTPDRFLAFGPVVDGVVIERAPLDALRAGAGSDIPLLVGTNAREWATFGGETDEQNADLIAGINALTGGPDDLRSTYRSLYEDDRACWAAFMTDATFAVPAIRAAEAHRDHCRDVFMYRFDWERPGHRRSGFHSFELPFVFDNLSRPDVEMVFTGPDPPIDLASRMSSTWAAFARHGVPSGPDIPKWSSYGDRRSTMSIDLEWRLTDDPNPRRRGAWDGIL
jgi:para-nitrobenzyl esterase